MVGSLGNFNVNAPPLVNYFKNQLRENLIWNYNSLLDVGSIFANSIRWYSVSTLSMENKPTGERFVNICSYVSYTSAVLHGFHEYMVLLK